MPGQLLPAVLEHLEQVWDQPDDGIWEIRGPRHHFTHSKVMAWVAFDRAIRIAKYRNWDHLPIDKWAKLRDEVHDQVCDKGFNAAKNSFVQYYGSDQLDASLLMLARVGFLPPTDPRIVGTVEAIQRELVVDGFVLRYITQDGDSVDGLPAGEGTFLMTTFWLADNLALIGRTDEAREVFERLRALSNDVGLFSEEYDPKEKRMFGNFPQAFSHLAFIDLRGPPLDGRRVTDLAAVPRGLTTGSGSTSWQLSTTTSSSSAAARAAARSRGSWPRPASASCCSSAATISRASATTGAPKRSS